MGINPGDEVVFCVTTCARRGTEALRKGEVNLLKLEGWP
jgi:hypothetical protein